LLPLIGRNVAEAEGGHGVEDTGKFLSGCFCCSCCCIGVKGQQLGLSGSAESLEGMTIAVDEEKCVSCGQCMEACRFKPRLLAEGSTSVNPKLCVGCGACVKECPEDAISFDVEDPELIDKYIARVEAIVDVTDQSLKV
jgi:ferredoxin